MPVLTSMTLGKLCREIAAQLSPLDVLLREWGIDDAAFARLIQSDGYTYEMGVIAREMKEMGADAGYVYRMKSLAEECVTDVVNLLKDPETPRATKVDLIKFVTEMGRLKEKPQVGTQVMGAQGPSVVFNFGAGLGVPTMRLTADPIEVEDTKEVPALTARKGFQIEETSGGDV